jgi:hypothetical protein
MLPECRCETRGCKFYKGIRNIGGGREVHYCVGFHEGIPDDIAYGSNDHLEPVRGQTRRAYFMPPDRNVVKPHPEKLMYRRRMWGRDNLCSTLRNIYLMTDDPEIRFWSRICVTMAKNMLYSLLEYKQMLIENGVDVNADRRPDWQVRPKNLYRGKK